jgi:hypothetical protein
MNRDHALPAAGAAGHHQNAGVAMLGGSRQVADHRAVIAAPMGGPTLVGEGTRSDEDREQKDDEENEHEPFSARTAVGSNGSGHDSRV